MEIDDSQVICVMADKLVQLKLHLIPFYFAQSSKYFSYSSSIIYLFECKKFWNKKKIANIFLKWLK